MDSHKKEVRLSLLVIVKRVELVCIVALWPMVVGMCQWLGI